MPLFEVEARYRSPKGQLVPRTYSFITVSSTATGAAKKVRRYSEQYMKEHASLLDLVVIQLGEVAELHRSHT